MRKYKLEVFEPPDERLRHRRDIHAADDEEAKRKAMEKYEQLAKGLLLDRFVLYDAKRVVQEYLNPKYHGDPNRRSNAVRINPAGGWE
jgi:hypothetical protein